MADPFASLGLPRRFDLDRRELEQRYRDLQRELHPDRHAAGTPAERRMALSKAMEVNEAYRTLKDDAARAVALRALLFAADASEEAEADPAFLMEIMELREALGEARAARDITAVEKLAARVRTQQQQVLAQLREDFGRAYASPTADVGVALSRNISKLKYFMRFLTEVQTIEDLALG